MRKRMRASSSFGSWFLPLLGMVGLLLGGVPSWAAAGDEPPRSLSPLGLQNLEAFTRLLGYVRFFHPSDQAVAADWDQVAIAGIQRIEAATSPADLASSLQSFFQPLAPTLRVYLEGDRPPLPADLLPPAGTANPEGTYWQHYGVQLPLTPPYTYTSQRLDFVGAPPEVTGLSVPADPEEVSLGRGVDASLPLTLYKNAQGTIPQVSAAAPTPDKPAGWTPSGNDRATRLAGVAEAWTVLQHFYPYFDLFQVDWPYQLERALLSAAQDANDMAFVTTLRQLMAALHDGHARVTYPAWDLDYQIPLTWTWLDDQLVITWADPVAAAGLGAGDVVLALNGQPASQVYNQELALAPGSTPQHLRWRAVQIMLLGPQDEEVQLRVRKARGGTSEVTVRRTYYVGGTGGIFLVEPRPPQISEIRPGIFYVDLNRITDDDFINALGQLASARGLIFDLREYPWNMDWITPLDYLATVPYQPDRFDIPIAYRPDRQGWRYFRDTFTEPPAAPHLDLRVAFLTSGASISFAETYMGMVETYHLGDRVGETTAGTNGNVNYISLPGNYTLRFSGMRVTKHDGARFEGVGVPPTVPVERTYAGIAAGRDEYLEKAIEVVSH